MKRIILVLFLLINFVQTPFSSFANETTVPDVIQKMRKSNSDVQDLTCLFVKEVNKGGKKIPKTSMMFKYLKKPETIFVEFINRFKGQKCLYIKGENNGKMIVRPSGFMKFMKVKINPAGKQAMAESLNPITEMVFDSVIDNFETSYDLSLTDDKFKAEFQKNVTEDGGLFHLLKIASDSKKDEYIYMHINRNNFLPYKIRYKSGDNTATYTYKNLVLNKNLKKSDFTI